MSEEEWRGLGVQQSQGWIHYMIHKPGQYVTLPVDQDCFNTYFDNLITV